MSLRDVKILIPPAVERGHRAILKCLYNLEGDALYTVKWYKNDREFFRYTPRDTPPIKQFPLPNHKVLERESNATQLVLEDVVMGNSGNYLCEVSADSPAFFTLERVAYMQVVQSPHHDPAITGLRHRYRPGDILEAECKSKHSSPPANLTWFVNGLDVEPMRIRHNKTRSPDGRLFISHSVLRMIITKDLFSQGRLKIRCVANLYNVYHRSSEISVELERPKPRLRPASTLSPTMSWESQHRQGSYPQTTLIFAPPEEQGSSTGITSVQQGLHIFSLMFMFSLR